MNKMTRDSSDNSVVNIAKFNDLHSTFTSIYTKNLSEMVHATSIDAMRNGLLVLPKVTTATPTESTTTDTVTSMEEHPFVAKHCPFSLLPSPFPSNLFHLAVELQPLFNKVIHNVANDKPFLLECLKDVRIHDSFVDKLVDCMININDPSDISFGVHRSDYMLHQPDTFNNSSFFSSPAFLHQVEVNTISAGLVSLSSIVTDVHRQLLESVNITGLNLPENKSINAVPNGIHKAWELYGEDSAQVVMVVQPNEWNVFDQTWISQKLQKQYGIKMIRKTLEQIFNEGSVTFDKRLFIDGKEIAVCYFRAGYCPKDFKTEEHWMARRMIEGSKSVKCPNIAYQLAGCKKVQQILAQEGQLERFMSDSKEVELMRSCFTGLYPLDETKLGLQAYQMALDSSNDFVLKPQREGGGNNYYNEGLNTMLKTLTTEERKSFILMDKIKGPPNTTIMIQDGKYNIKETISELGIFGVWISKKNSYGKIISCANDNEEDTVIINESSGHLLRTKDFSMNEGGVSAGASVIDSPYLI